MEKKTKTYSAEPDKSLTVNEPEMAYETTPSKEKTALDEDIPEGYISLEELRQIWHQKVHEYFTTGKLQ